MADIPQYVWTEVEQNVWSYFRDGYNRQGLFCGQTQTATVSCLTEQQILAIQCCH